MTRATSTLTAVITAPPPPWYARCSPSLASSARLATLVLACTSLAVLAPALASAVALALELVARFYGPRLLLQLGPARPRPRHLVAGLCAGARARAPEALDVDPDLVKRSQLARPPEMSRKAPKDASPSSVSASLPPSQPQAQSKWYKRGPARALATFFSPRPISITQQHPPTMSGLYPRAAKETPAIDVLYPPKGGASYPVAAGLPESARGLLSGSVDDIVERQPDFYLASHYASTRIYNKITRRVVVGGAPPIPPARRRRPFPVVLVHPALLPGAVDKIPFLHPIDLNRIAPPVYRLLDATNRIANVVNENLALGSPEVQKYLSEFDGDLPPFFFRGLKECDHCSSDPDHTGSCLFATLGRAAPSSTPAFALRCLWSIAANEATTFSFKTSTGVEVKNVELFAALVNAPKKAANGDDKPAPVAFETTVWWDGKDPKPVVVDNSHYKGPVTKGVATATKDEKPASQVQVFVPLRPEVRIGVPPKGTGAGVGTGIQSLAPETDKEDEHDPKKLQVILKDQSKLGLITVPPVPTFQEKVEPVLPVLNLAELVVAPKAAPASAPGLVRDLAAVFDSHAEAARVALTTNVYHARVEHASKVEEARAAFEAQVKAADAGYVAKVEVARAEHAAGVEEHNRRVRAVAAAVGQIGLIAAK
ncbi:hypothetical protein Q8F55_001749 [Vanrija albida]|uniref:Uncharacterized protein n=1 Tax=Vanrija albida TaxID=181172 RepID=A0ABR3Q8P7_9TREE